jgi:hypothetical protein
VCKRKRGHIISKKLSEKLALSAGIEEEEFSNSQEATQAFLWGNLIAGSLITVYFTLLSTF